MTVYHQNNGDQVAFAVDGVDKPSSCWPYVLGVIMVVVVILLPGMLP